MKLQDMTHPLARAVTLGILAVSAAAPLTAQQGATSLSALLQRADATVQVRVLSVRTVSSATRTAVLRHERTIDGVGPTGTFSISEPAPRACGRALHGLLPGTSCVAFLRRAANGEFELVGGGARALVQIQPGLVDHLAQLAAAPTGGDEGLHALVAGLDSASPRVRRDAALALPYQPRLHTLTGSRRARVAQEVQHAIERADVTALPMLDAAARLEVTEVVPSLVAHLLDGTAPELDEKILRTAARIDSVRTGAELTQHVAALASTTSGSVANSAAAGLDRAPRPHDRALRAVALLETLSGDVARPALELLTEAGRATPVRARAATAWVRLGLDAQGLRDRIGAAQYDAACERCARGSERPPVFRSIRVRRQR